MAAPIMAGERRLGVVKVFSPSVRRFVVDDISLLTVYQRVVRHVARNDRAGPDRPAPNGRARWKRSRPTKIRPAAPSSRSGRPWSRPLPQTRGEEIVHAHALERFEELNRVRAERRLADRERLHPVMWVLLVVGAVATVGSMFFFNVEPLWLQGLLSGMVGGVLGFIMFVVHDLDDPFDGFWRIDPGPILRAVGIQLPDERPPTSRPSQIDRTAPEGTFTR